MAVSIEPGRHRAVLFDLDGVVTDAGAVFDDARSLVARLREQGVRTAVFSAGRNCRDALAREGIADLFDARVDGSGPPGPAVLLEAARRVRTEPRAAAVVVAEDATAAREAGFGLVIAVARHGAPQPGPVPAVTSLADVAVAASPRLRLSAVSDALDGWEEIAARLRGRDPVFVFDFDGTLAPIRDDPDAVALPPENRRVLEQLAAHHHVAVLSGRDLQDVRARVPARGLWYAGSHGFEVAGPSGEHFCQPDGAAAVDDLDEAERRLSAACGSTPGALIDRKRFALAVHYRRTPPDSVDDLLAAVRDVADASSALRVTRGRMVVEVLPNVAWDKGRALRLLLDEWGLAGTALPVFAGDDYTDEDALREIHHDGIGVVVRSAEHGDRLTWAHYAVDDPDELAGLLDRMAAVV
ncbi:hypothetical protein GCM10025787_45340 [Saccharopolyspora rosea]|uniref:Trehalose 6-phosphate phosphatase n=1 Tax=Saccharopolyspora rosea TaxID=524884 RepID=A0ABW3G0D0_9PSEU